MGQTKTLHERSEEGKSRTRLVVAAENLRRLAVTFTTEEVAVTAKRMNSREDLTIANRAMLIAFLNQLRVLAAEKVAAAEARRYEAMTGERPNVHRHRCISFLRVKFDHLEELIEEYISEAEHQDGETYWEHFKGEADIDREGLEADVLLYVINKGGN